MSQSGFTPIQLYRSSTAAAVPTAGNLAAGELAINTTDEKLYFENTGGTVTLLASSAAAGGTFTTVTATTVVNGLGAVGTPSYTFTGDLNTGMWSPAADTLAFSTAGSERLRIDSSGRLLVGIGSPIGISTVPVQSPGGFISANDAAGLRLLNSAQNGGGTVFSNTGLNGGISIGSDAGPMLFVSTTERMRISSSGFVGIGTTTPGALLDVNGVGRFGGTPSIISVGLNGDSISSNGDFYVQTSTANPLILRTNFAEVMRLTSAGLVGIGTTAPSAQLAVTPPSNPATATGTLQVAIGEATNNSIYQMRMGYLLDGTYKGVINVLAGGNGADLLLNPSGGAVGIGTAAGKAAFTITRNSSIASVGLSASIVLSNRNTTLNGGIAGGIFIDTFRDVADPHYTGGVWFTRSSQVGNFSSSSDIIFGAANTIDVNALPTERMRISGFTGHVGIGTVGPGSRLHVEDASPARGIVETIRGTGGTGAQVHFSQDGVADWALGQPAGVNALAFFSGRNPVTDGNERMRIDSAGALRVNETTNGFTSSLRLSVTADPNEGTFLFKNSAGNVQWTGWVWNSATSGDNLFIQFLTEAGGTGRGSIIYNRGAGLLAFNTTSDYRAKDILGPVTDAGATIDAIKVHNGKMKGATVARPMLVAHEAQEVVPYAVMGEKDAINKDGTAKYQQMDHQSLVPLLIAEVQSLRARVAQLEGK